MSLTQEEIKELKDQLKEQVKNLPEDKKAQALKQIESLSPEALESMVKQQNSQSKPIFRSIVDKEIPSKIIDENKQAIAALDIKPISKGHTIIIPKNAVKDAKLIPTQCFTLAKKVAKRISSKLKSKGFEIQTQFSFGEVIINVIPIYDKSLNINSPRENSEEKELELLYQQLRVIKKARLPKIKKTSNLQSQETIKLNRKIP